MIKTIYKKLKNMTIIYYINKKYKKYKKYTYVCLFEKNLYNKYKILDFFI